MDREQAPLFENSVLLHSERTAIFSLEFGRERCHLHVGGYFGGRTEPVNTGRTFCKSGTDGAAWKPQALLVDLQCGRKADGEGGGTGGTSV